MLQATLRPIYNMVREEDEKEKKKKIVDANPIIEFMIVWNASGHFELKHTDFHHHLFRLQIAIMK